MIFVNLIVSCCLVTLGGALSNFEACASLKDFRGTCYTQDKSVLYFDQNYKNLNVRYKRTGKTTLNVHCRNFGTLQNIPVVNFEEVKTVELQECSLKNDNILSEIIKSFSIGNVATINIISIGGSTKILLSEKIFHGLTELRYLKIETNQFVSFDKSVFRPICKKLAELVLIVHDISLLANEVFEKLSNLKKLSIIQKHGKKIIPELGFTLKNCVNLKTFSMSGVSVHEINKLLPHISMMKMVDIRDNDIERITEKIFSNSLELSTIVMSKNGLKSLPRNVFETQKDALEFLDLSFNQLETIDNAVFNANTDIRTLDLSHNKLRIINK